MLLLTYVTVVTVTCFNLEGAAHCELGARLILGVRHLSREAVNPLQQLPFYHL